jgi:hypothetical protein
MDRRIGASLQLCTASKTLLERQKKRDQADAKRAVSG